MKYLIILTIFFIVSPIYGHKNVSVFKKIRNVEVTSFTSSFNEKTYRPLILAEYVSFLSKKHNFKNKIVIVFNESDITVDSTLCYFSKNKKFRKRELNIIFNKNDIDISKSINLIDHLIKNLSRFPLNNSEIINVYNSENINEVLTNKVYRPNDIDELNTDLFINYFFKENKFHFYEKNDNTETILFSFSNLYMFNVYNSLHLVVFNNENEISYIHDINKKVIDKFSIDIKAPFLYCKINYLENKILTFDIMNNKFEENVVCYLIDEKIVIQNLKEEILNSKLKKD